MNTLCYCIVTLLSLYINKFHISGHIIKDVNINGWNGTVPFVKNNFNEIFEKKEDDHIANTKKPTPEEIELTCKKGFDNYASRFIPIDEVAFNQDMLKRNTAGELTYFEMHIAVKADKSATIELTETLKFGLQYLDHKIILAADDNNNSELAHHYRLVIRRYWTPDILSSTEFRNFYLKIDDGNLEFGKEGDIPFITHFDHRYKYIKYLNFYAVTGDIVVHFPSQLPSYC